jgi:hypothetical protein
MRRCWVFGGGYQIGGKREFCLVKPTGQNALPYVYLDEEEARAVFRLVEHHAHLYCTEDCHELTLVASGCAWHPPVDVYAPRHVELSESEAARVYAGMLARVHAVEEQACERKEEG